MSDWLEENQSLVFGVILCVVFVLTFCCVCDSLRSVRRAYNWSSLHMPLLPSSSNLRLDAALRDAEEGFHVCMACGFENLKRSIFCTICGSPIECTDEDSKKKRKKLKVKDKLYHERQRASTNLNHRRQARALRRKEWLRKLDVEGNLYWYRDATINSDTRFKGFVLHFAGDPPVTVEPSAAGEPENESTIDTPTDDVVINMESPSTIDTPSSDATAASTVPSSSPLNGGETTAVDGQDALDNSTDAAASDATDADQVAAQAQRKQRKQELQLRTLPEISASLLEEIRNRRFSLIESTQADPARPAINDTTEAYLRADAKRIVDHASLDFPSKVAEFVTRTSTVLMPAEQSFLKLKIRRDQLLSDSIETLAATPAKFSRCTIRLTFMGEQGLDAGGVYREWLVMIYEKIVSRRAGIFRCVNREDQTFHLNRMSQYDIGEYHLAHFFAAGRLLGRALLEGNVTGFHLSLPLLKMIVGQPVTFSDLAYYDAETYKNLLWLLEHDGAEHLGLDFTVTEQSLRGETVTVELIPGGKHIDVTDANKHEYVERKFKYMVFESVATQLFAFLKGLHEVMPPEMLMMFDAEELDYLLSGSDEIDVDDWERNAKYTADLIEHPVREWFWELVREMPNEYRRRLLLFATGSSRVPLAGFMALTSYEGRLCPFTLKGVELEAEGGYIRSHACFNRLDIPRYNTKHQLTTVLYAVLDTDLYGFTTD